MSLTWLESLIYGILSGLGEFLPVSSLTHQAVYLKLIGKQNDPLLRCCGIIGALAAVFIYCIPQMHRIRRERRIAAQSRSRRRRPPDAGALMESRVFRTAAVAVIAVLPAYWLTYQIHQRLWILALMIFLNGLVLYIPQFLPGSNKTAPSMSALDAMLIGISGGCGMVPGISAIGSMLSAGSVRGLDRQYAMELSLMLSVPALTVLLFSTGITGFQSFPPLTGGMILRCITVMLSAFGGGYVGIILMRFLSVRVGFSGFAQYCWGLSLFALILYLI